MYVNRGRLPHLLAPRWYSDAGLYERELELVFRPGWHLVGTRADLANHGDFTTLDLFGVPVLVRNHRGEICAYVNVCAHRHAMMTCEPHGNCPTLRCQYHGWEYHPDGRPQKVRRARSFLPVVADAERLRTLPVAGCGQLLFVSTADDPPALDTYLGATTWQFGLATFGADYRQVRRWRVTHPANWKIPTENGIECYHVPIAHKQTLQKMSRDAAVRHELGETYTTLFDRGKRESPTQRALMHALRDRPSELQIHHHRFPSLTMVRGDYFSYVQMVAPTGPRTSESHIRLFMHRGDGRGRIRGLARRLLSRALAVPVASVTTQVVREDNGLFAAIQRGMDASPHAGVIGACEERIFCFQSWLRAQLEVADPRPAAAPPDASAAACAATSATTGGATSAAMGAQAVGNSDFRSSEDSP